MRIVQWYEKRVYAFIAAALSMAIILFFVVQGVTILRSLAAGLLVGCSIYPMAAIARTVWYPNKKVVVWVVSIIVIICLYGGVYIIMR